MKTKTITLHQLHDVIGARDEFEVQKTTDSTEFLPGAVLKREQVQELCDNKNWKVTIAKAAMLLALLFTFAPSPSEARDGYHHRAHFQSYGWPYYGGYRSLYGWQVPGCKGWPCLSNNARVIELPENMQFNENPNWGRDGAGKLCRSCFDASK